MGALALIFLLVFTLSRLLWSDLDKEYRGLIFGYRMAGIGVGAVLCFQVWLLALPWKEEFLALVLASAIPYLVAVGLGYRELETRGVKCWGKVKWPRY